MRPMRTMPKDGRLALGILAASGSIYSKRFMTICECPPTVSFEELAIKPGQRTPLDKLGFPQRCCGCIPLKFAVVIICMVSFIWAAYELQRTDKFMVLLFPSRGNAFYYCKIFYLLWSICFLLTCGVLLLGIVFERFELLNVYIWSAFLYTCSYLLIIISTTIISVISSGSVEKKSTIRTVFSILWTCFFLYLIIVVNSYKLVLWYKHLGF